MKKYTIVQIKGTYNPAADGTSWISRRMLRPVSFYLTFLMLKCRVSANQATILGLISGVLSSIFFITGQQTYLQWGVLFYILFYLYDFVDGNIARVTDTASYYGKFLDGIVDVIVEVLLPFSLAAGFYFSGQSLVFLFIGVTAAILLLFAVFVINRASFFNRWIRMEENDEKINLNPINTGKLPMKTIYVILTDFKFIVLFIAFFTGLNTYLLLAFEAAVVIWSGFLIYITMLDASRQLNVHRVSKMDTRLKKK